LLALTTCRLSALLLLVVVVFLLYFLFAWLVVRDVGGIIDHPL
jgi:succinate dehydrogenase hydrophobic anchor subunit